MTPGELAAAEEAMRAAVAREDWHEASRIGDELDAANAARPRPSLVGAALWYAELGLPVFPLLPRSKKPMPRSHGLKDATTDGALIERWWRATPFANVGLATGHGVDVIDFDGPTAHVSWGVEYPGDWSEAGVRVLATVSTPREGGLHVYLPTPSDRPGNRAGLVARVDYRGLGGYVVAPPSVTDLGTYDFVRPLHPEDLR